MRRITKYTIWVAVLAGMYYVAGYHFIYFGGLTVKKLKKKEITFSRTFFSTELKTPEQILTDDVLREAGLADLLIEMGLLTEERKNFILKKFEAGD